MSENLDAPPPDESGDIYVQMQASEDFQHLRRTFRNFVFPMTVAFLAWYFLFVLMADYAHDFMSKQAWGNITVGLVFGLLQFVSTFLITWAYVRFADRRLDPISTRIRTEIEGGAS